MCVHHFTHNLFHHGHGTSVNSVDRSLFPKLVSLRLQGIDFTNLENEDENMRNLFNQYDLDGNGEIDQDELYAIVDDMLHNKASSIYIVQVRGASRV